MNQVFAVNLGKMSVDMWVASASLVLAVSWLLWLIVMNIKIVAKYMASMIIGAAIWLPIGLFLGSIAGWFVILGDWAVRNYTFPAFDPGIMPLAQLGGAGAGIIADGAVGGAWIHHKLWPKTAKEEAEAPAPDEEPDEGADEDTAFDAKFDEAFDAKFNAAFEAAWRRKTQADEGPE